MRVKQLHLTLNLFFVCQNFSGRIGKGKLKIVGETVSLLFSHAISPTFYNLLLSLVSFTKKLQSKQWLDKCPAKHFSKKGTVQMLVKLVVLAGPQNIRIVGATASKNPDQVSCR
jgi:hypothetical protein